MKQEDMMAALEAVKKSGITVNGDLVLEKKVDYEVANVENGGIGIQINNYYGVEQQKAQESQALTREELAQAVVAVQSFMWGSSAYAVLFCELRDHKGYSNNMAQFERDITEIGEQHKLDWPCAEGTLSDAFRHNSFLEKHVDRWADIGAKSRAILLLDKFQQALTQ